MKRRGHPSLTVDTYRSPTRLLMPMKSFDNQDLEGFTCWFRKYNSVDERGRSPGDADGPRHLEIR